MTIRQDHPVSRRAALAGLGAGGFGFALAARGLSAATQEGTPPAAEGTLEGVAFEPLGFGTTEEIPAAPAEFALSRAVIDPGAVFSRQGDIVSLLSLLYVESGALTIQMDASIQVTRTATIEEIAIEEVAAGTAVTLEAGDSVVIPPNVAGEIRNDGDEPAVYLVAFVAPSEEGGATPEA